MIKCEKCGEGNSEVLVVHHRDRNRKNNKPDNLAILCANCHMKMHKGHRRAERLRKVEIDNLFNVKASDVHVS
jgi:5-methylcytosine-specific restriction endonuclease McrA